MTFESTYDIEFDRLFDRLKQKYPHELFNLEGIGDQTDMGEFSRKFFSAADGGKATVADNSVDANSNVDDMTVVAYENEMPKPYSRLNSLYLLWKYMRKEHGLTMANDMVERELVGEIYINDLSNVQKPYSYYEDTVVVAKIEGEMLYASMKNLFLYCSMLGYPSVSTEDCIEVFPKDAYLLDADSKWTKLERVLRHKSHTNLKLISAGGMMTAVTSDHPVITNSGDVQAGMLTANHKIAMSMANFRKITKDGVTHQCEEDCFLMGCDAVGVGIVPSDILEWEMPEIEEFVRGAVSSCARSSIHDNTYHIIHPSFAFVQQIAELAKLANPQWKVIRVGIESENDKEGNPIFFADIDFNYDSTVMTSDVVEFADISEIKNWITPNYVYDVTTSSGHFHCQGMKQHNCYNFSAYDVMSKGLPFVRKVKSGPPKHLSSFCGQMVHFTSYASNQVMGAVGIADLLIVMSYYVDKELNENKPEIHDYIWKQVKQEIQSLVFSMNQPFRGGLQSGFYNLSIYDDEFLKSLVGDYIFPDGSSPNINTIKKLQDIYLDLMNETLKSSAVTFPVTTACFCVDEARNLKDEEFLRYIAHKNLRWAFINIYAGETSTLSSCCRLRSNKSNQYIGYTNSFGGAGTQVGSFGVCTINLPHIALSCGNNRELFFSRLKDTAKMILLINDAKRTLLKKRIDAHALPLYDYGFIDLQKQYATIGLNGVNECIGYLGEDIKEPGGQALCKEILAVLNQINDEADEMYKYAHNLEQTPSENSAIKLASKDRLLGLQSDCKLYSNQFIPLNVEADMLDRIRLQGMFDSEFSGGSILHINVDTPLSREEDMMDLIKATVKCGCVYHAINLNLQKCENGHMSVGRGDTCPECGALITDNYIRVVGFLVNVKNFHKVRKEEDYAKRQFYSDITQV